MPKKHCSVCLGGGKVLSDLEKKRIEYNNSGIHQDNQILRREPERLASFAGRNGFSGVAPELVACLDCNGTGIVEE